MHTAALAALASLTLLDGGSSNVGGGTNVGLVEILVMSSAHEVASASLAELRASFDLTQGMVPALGILAHLVGPSGRGWGPAAFAFAIALKPP